MQLYARDSSLPLNAAIERIAKVRSMVRLAPYREGMIMTHTPWTVEESNEVAYVGNDGDEAYWEFFTVGPAQIHYNHYDKAAKEEARQHADLIAAAPDLLNLAIVFKAYLEDDSRSERRRQACLDECKSLINKATGNG